MTTTVLIADDHPIVRSGLRILIDREADFEVVAEAATGAAAVEHALAHEVDLVILDVAMPEKTGLQAAQEILDSRPATRVLLLSMYDSDQYLLAAARIGVAGYVLKSVADAEIVSACRACLTDDRFVVPWEVSDETRVALEQAQGNRRAALSDDVLTRRELEVLKLVAEGRSSQEIADQLVISPKTVERHRSNIMDKLGLRDRVQLARYAIRRGLIAP